MATDYWHRIKELRETLLKNESFRHTDNEEIQTRVESVQERKSILESIENIFNDIVEKFAENKAPKLSYVNQRNWNNVTEIYYENPKLFLRQITVDIIVDNISCMLQVPRHLLHVTSTSKGCVSGDLQFIDANGRHVDCSLRKSGKGFPDLNTRQMVKKLWDTLHIPILALVDADPHGVEIMCIYRFGSLASSYDNLNLAVPAIRWLGLLPTDIQNLRISQTALLPLVTTDRSKLKALRQRPYCNGPMTSFSKCLRHQLDTLEESGYKAEIQSLNQLSPSFLSATYLPNKISCGGWI